MENESRVAVIQRYFCPESGLFYDDGLRLHLSEHANVLASLLGLRKDEGDDWLGRLRNRNASRCSVYFTHYLLESLYRERRNEHFFSRLEFWHTLLDNGLHTIPEQPEPTRSDSHAWGAHPLYHIYASIAGIRPASPCFRSAHVRPMLGQIKQLEGTLPHPDGEIRFSFRVNGSCCEVTIILPLSVGGTLEMGSQVQFLAGGKNSFIIELPKAMPSDMEIPALLP